MAFRVVRQNRKQSLEEAQKELRKSLYQQKNIFIKDTKHEAEYDDTFNKEFLRRQIKNTTSSELELQGRRKKAITINVDDDNGEEDHGQHIDKLDRDEFGYIKTAGRFPIKILDPNRVHIEPHDARYNSYTCSSGELRKWLIFCSILHCGGAIATLVLWFLMYYEWPLIFPSEFEVGSYIFRQKWPALILATEPSLAWILLINVIVQGKYKPWIIKCFYQTTFWFLLGLCFICANCIYFLSNLQLTKVKERLESGMENYYQDPPNIRAAAADYEFEHHEDFIVRDGWDKLQRYLECCGSESFEDWRFIRRTDDGLHGTLLPNSCCKAAGENCTIESGRAQAHVWTDGCAMKTYELLSYVGSIVLFFALFGIVIHIICIILTKMYYVAIMKIKQNGLFEYSAGEFWSDIFCCKCWHKRCKGRRCNCCKRRSSTVGPLKLSVGDDDEQKRFEQQGSSKLRKKKDEEVVVLYKHKQHSNDNSYNA